MLCSACHEEREEKDFFKKAVCFRCQYKEKMKNEDSSYRRRCKECNAFLSSKRWAYCSEGCAQLGAAKSKQGHWTRHLI